MKISEASKILQAVLLKSFDEREANNITKLFWEDLFGYRGGIDRNLHTRELLVFEKALSDFELGLPLQYVTGVSYFYDLKLEVNDAVLIPRPETEELVYEILSDKLPESSTILDIGTGSGCIAISLKSKHQRSEVTAIDLSKKALDVARRNAEKNECKVEFRNIDFLDEGQWKILGKFDIIASNPPYISRSEMKVMTQATLMHEPELALYPESDDVLIFYRKIAAFGLDHLNPSGKVYLECNEYNASEVESIFKNSSYRRVELKKDMQGKDRMLVIHS